MLNLFEYRKRALGNGNNVKSIEENSMQKDKFDKIWNLKI